MIKLQAYIEISISQGSKPQRRVLVWSGYQLVITLLLIYRWLYARVSRPISEIGRGDVKNLVANVFFRPILYIVSMYICVASWRRNAMATRWAANSLLTDETSATCGSSDARCGKRCQLD